MSKLIKECCSTLWGLPGKLKVMFALNFLLMLLSISLLWLGLAAYNYTFPASAGLESDRDDASSLQAELATRTEAGGVAASASGHLFAGTSIDKEWVLLGDWSLQRSRMAPGDWSLRDDPGV